MPAELIDGVAVAEQVRREVARSVADMASPPGLATVLVGDDPASEIYVSRKRAMCVEAGIRDLHGRSDSTINRGGIRIGTAEIYRAVLESEEIVDRTLRRPPRGRDPRRRTAQDPGPGDPRTLQPPPTKVVSRDSLANPEALDYFVGFATAGPSWPRQGQRHLKFSVGRNSEGPPQRDH